jgi:malto-oligosyltrehalose trehalohydrolase
VSEGFIHKLPFGASIGAEGEVRFRFWAPAQETVSVAIEGGALVPMQRSPDGWFETTLPKGTEAGTGQAAGLRYRYRLSDGTLVPDPASRAQPDDVHGPSMVVDATAYQWRNPDWQGRPWRETVLYELHAGALGGFRGVMKRLPRLKELGITAVELMPVSDFPGRHNWGYDGVLPYAPDSAYGTSDDLKALVDAAHDHSLMIFLDVVYNHFGPDGNYLSLYAPQFFREDRHTPWGPAIDLRRPEVRAFFTENVLYWLMEYRFDGLRFDAVHAIEDQDWVDEMAAAVRATVEPGRQVHLVLEHHNDADHLAKDCDAQWNDDGHNVLHVLLTGEDGGYYRDYADRPADKLARVLAEGWAYQGEPSAYLGVKRGTPSRALPPTAHVLFLQNHDQTGNRAFGERLTVLADPDALEAAIALVMLSPQIPLIFMGEEVASRTPFLFFTDHGAELAEAVRKGRREEFKGFPEFQDPRKRETIPDPNAPKTFQDSVPVADPETGAARFALYQRLIAMRLAEIAPRLDGAQAIEARACGDRAVAASWRLGGGAILSLATNFGTDPAVIPVPTGRLLFETRGAGRLAQSGSLPAHGAVCFLDTA